MKLGYDGLPKERYEQDIMACTATTGSVCVHEDGWYFTVNFWIFKKRMFWCDKCHSPLEVTILDD